MSDLDGNVRYKLWRKMGPDAVAQMIGIDPVWLTSVWDDELVVGSLLGEPPPMRRQRDPGSPQNGREFQVWDSGRREGIRQGMQNAAYIASLIQPSSVSATGEAHMRGFRDAIVHEIRKKAGGTQVE